MRASTRTTARRATAIAIAALLTLGSSAALADEHDLDVGGGDVDGTDESDEADVDVGAQPDADDQSDTDVGGVATTQQLLSPVTADCEPALVTFTPDATTGVEAAVAVTAQAIDRDVEGWLHVSWEVQPGAEISAVTVHNPSGSWTLTDGLESGTLEEVLELRFCGTFEGPADDAPDGDGATDDADQTETTNSPPAPAPAPAQPSTPTPAPAPDADTDTEAAGDQSLPAVVEVETPRPDATDTAGTPGTPDTDADADELADDDVEVLGVQLTRDPNEVGGGGLGAAWITAIVLLVLAAAGLTWWIRGGQLSRGSVR